MPVWLASALQWLVRLFGPMVWKAVAAWLAKKWTEIKSAIARRARAKEQEKQAQKHEEVVNKPGATDEELGQSFEDTLNSGRR